MTKTLLIASSVFVGVNLVFWAGLCFVSAEYRSYFEPTDIGTFLRYMGFTLGVAGFGGTIAHRKLP